MVLLRYNDYELRTVETAVGHSFPLITGVCIWHQGNYIGIVEPANDAIAKFTMYPEFTLNHAVENWAELSKVINVATDIVQSILSLI